MKTRKQSRGLSADSNLAEDAAISSAYFSHLSELVAFIIDTLDHLINLEFAKKNKDGQFFIQIVHLLTVTS